MRTCQYHARSLLVLAIAVVLPALAGAHGPAGQEVALAPLDPELFSGWQTWVHLLVQWAHLLGLPLWLGVLVAAWLFRALTLERLLFAAWAVLLLQGLSGAYNMEYSAGIPTAPSLLQWPVVGVYDFGRSYTALLGVKQGLYGLAVLVTLLVTALHVRRPKGIDGRCLRTGYVAAQIGLGVLIAVATTGVLVLHEAADVSPTPVHALGGVMGLEGQPVSPSPQTLPEPYRSQALTSLAAGWHVVVFLIQWPTLPTLVLGPVLVGLYLRLAKREEQALEACFGPRSRLYQQRVPGFLPVGGG